MVIEDSLIQALILKNHLSLEYEIQQVLEHEIIAEASASTTVKQKNALKELLDRARANLKIDGSIISVELSFLSVPKGMEDYANMLKMNAVSKGLVILKNQLVNIFTLDDAEEYIRNHIKQYAIEQLRGSIGGVL